MDFGFNFISKATRLKKLILASIAFIKNNDATKYDILINK